MNIKKLMISAMLVALAVSLSSFAIPIGASKCFPIQHLANVIADVSLGPGYGVAMALCTSLMRNLMDTESLLAFPGSMIGALICDLAYRYSGKLMPAYTGEVFGTDIVDSILCYPVATIVTGKEAVILAYAVPFLMGTLCGTVITAFLIGVLYRSGALKYMKRSLDTDIQPSEAMGK